MQENHRLKGELEATTRKAREAFVIEPPWDEIDEGIRPLVRLLYDAGIETGSSCQGGNHSPHATVLPVVGMACSRDEFFRKRNKTVRVMIQAGWSGFSITHEDRFDYQKMVTPWACIPTLVVTVWTLKGQPGTPEEVKT